MTSVSQTLRQAREAKSITLEEVAQRTYIKLPYLLALEEGDLDKLPAPVYIHGYIRQYAKLLGLNGSELVLRYQQDTSRPAAPKLSLSPTRHGTEAARMEAPRMEPVAERAPLLASDPREISLTRTVRPAADPQSLRRPLEPLVAPRRPDHEPSLRRIEATLAPESELPQVLVPEPALDPMPPSGHEMLAQAKLQSHQILSSAQREAHEMRIAAERYADHVLAQLESEVARSLQTVRNGRAFLQSRRRKLQET